MKTSYRQDVFNKAQQELLEFMLDLQEKHDLTMQEYVLLLTNEIGREVWDQVQTDWE